MAYSSGHLEMLSQLKMVICVSKTILLSVRGLLVKWIILRVEVKCCACNLLNYWVARVLGCIGVSSQYLVTSSLDKKYIIGGSGYSLPFYLIIPKKYNIQVHRNLFSTSTLFYLSRKNVIATENLTIFIVYGWNKPFNLV